MPGARDFGPGHRHLTGQVDRLHRLDLNSSNYTRAGPADTL
ncbi:hypothetical protein ACFQX7_01690 [Luedemannella flava]